jgi:hypothetical protein
MPATKSAATKPVQTLADATAKTRSLIEDLQARLTGDAGSTTLERPRHARRELITAKEVINEEAVGAPLTAKDETEEDLDRQLQAYFDRMSAENLRSEPVIPSPAAAYTLEDIRARVIEKVAERILAEWSHPELGGAAGAAIRREVIDRLTGRVLEMLQNAAATEKEGSMMARAATST